MARGDLIVLAEGDRVPGDAVLLQAHDLQADESLLTGETVLVRKVSSTSIPASRARPGSDDLPFVYFGYQSNFPKHNRRTDVRFATNPKIGPILALSVC